MCRLAVRTPDSPSGNVGAIPTTINIGNYYLNSKIEIYKEIEMSTAVTRHHVGTGLDYYSFKCPECSEISPFYYNKDFPIPIGDCDSCHNVVELDYTFIKGVSK